MNIPKKIKIGEHLYDIKKVRVVDWNNSAVGGSINYLTKKMILKKGSSDKKIIETTFFHEVAHGLLKELEYNHPKASKFRCDEEFVAELGLELRKTFIDLLESQDKGD